MPRSQRLDAAPGSLRAGRHGESANPYTVPESNFTIRTLQPLATNRYAVFFTHPRETITFHYERDPDDPRIGHTLTLAVDDYGNVLTSASIGYARRKPALEEQSQVLATLDRKASTPTRSSSPTRIAHRFHPR